MNGADVLAGAAIAALALVVIPVGMFYAVAHISRKFLSTIIREVLREQREQQAHKQLIKN